MNGSLKLMDKWRMHEWASEQIDDGMNVQYIPAHVCTCIYLHVSTCTNRKYVYNKTQGIIITLHVHVCEVRDIYI